MSSGGGSGGGTSADTAYNARMATIAEQQQSMANQMFDFWEKGGGKYEEQIVTPATEAKTTQVLNPNYRRGTSSRDDRDSGDIGNTVNTWDEYITTTVPGTEAVTKQVWVDDPNSSSYKEMEQAQIDANMDLIPKQTQYQITQMDSETGLIPKRAGLESAQIDEATSNIALRKPVTEKFYQQAGEGINVDERTNLARADVEAAYAGAESDMRRSASSMGLNPASKKYGAGLLDLARQKAAAKVGAASLARRQAEETNFSRLSAAMGLQSV
jgi:hypothetical protein